MKLLKICFVLACFHSLYFSGDLKALSQSSPPLVDGLLRAGRVNSIDSAGMEPWHLKIEVEMLDGKGAVSGQGTIEEWWAKEDMYRLTYTLGSRAVTQLRTQEGTFRTKAPDPSVWLLDAIWRQVVHPVPSGDELTKAALTSEEVPFGTARLGYVMAGENISGVKKLPNGLFPTYCMDPAQPNVLRVAYYFGGLIAQRNQMSPFQGKIVPMSITVNRRLQPIARAKVTLLEKMPLTEADFLPTDGLAKVPGNPLVVTKDPPKAIQTVLPHGTRTGRERVELKLKVGWDGRVHEVQAASYTDGDFAINAIYAVSQWIFSPYMVNGEPTDCELTIVTEVNKD